jgi:hypothetical protein
VFLLDLGSLAKTSVGVGIGGGIEYSNWQLQIQAVAWREQELVAQAYPGYGARVRRSTAYATTCRGYRASWFGISPCLSLGFDYISANGMGKNVQASKEHALGIVAGVGAQTRIYMSGRLRLLLAVGSQWGVSRPNLWIAQLGSVSQFALASFVVSTGFEWVF